MPRQCERPGCSAPASVSYGFEATSAVVWLDRFAEDQARQLLGVLCRRHADALRPPRGWWLDDRRVSTPRLFTVESDTEPDTDEDPTGACEPTDEPADPAEDPPPTEPPPPTRRRKTVPHTELSFDFGSDAFSGESLESDERDSADAVTAPGASAGPAANPERADGEAPEQDAGPPAHGSAAHDPDETLAMPWTPVFDRADDLDGVLSARSPLLSRAFGLRRPGS